jgi:two-component system, chemotaxis family, protein-glutamate methylesterase/glutaminase
MMRSPRPILVVSTVSSEREKDLSLSATQAGALMALAKPEGPGSARFREQSAQLVSMVRAMSTVKVVRRWRAAEPAAGCSGRCAPRPGRSG